MGKVFSPEEVRGGYVPELGAHQKAAAFLLESLFEPATGSHGEITGVDSVLIYGSTTFGPSIRSDVDALICYNPNQANIALPAIRSRIRKVEESYNVPIEAQVLYTGALQSPLENGVDPLFLRHLASVQELSPQWQRGRPIPEESLEQELDGAQIVKIAVAYCSNRTREFAKALTAREHKNGLLMQRALEIPGAIGRKVLAATLDLNDLPVTEVRAIVEKAWATKRVTEKLIDLAGKNDEAVTKLGKLAAINSEYSVVLETAISGEMTIDEYTSWLKSHREQSYLLAHDVSYRWAEVLRQQLATAPSRLDTVLLGDYDHC